MIDPTSPQFVAGRIVAVVAIERLIRERTAIVVWGAAAAAALLIVATVVSDGLGAVLLGLLALVVAAVAATLFAVRSVVIRGLRRIGGGPDFPRLRPVVERRMDEVKRASGIISLDAPGAFRLARLARRPADLREHVRETAAIVARAIPQVVEDVRRELERPAGPTSVTSTDLRGERGPSAQ